MKWIDAGDIRNWITSKQRHCQQTLPELVRRLILAHTMNNVDEFNFPSGDSVGNHGWDGHLDTPTKFAFFPEGVSGWEMSSQNERSIQTKANKDYDKRTKNPLGLTPSETTFVFVTPQIFPKSIEWQKKKLATKKWKDVRLIDGDILEQWLNLTPATSLWLARQIKDGISGAVRDIEADWEWWALATQPPMTVELVLGGRSKDTERIHQWIAQNPDVLGVLAPLLTIYTLAYLALMGLDFAANGKRVVRTPHR